jgi:hypothetical protein
MFLFILFNISIYTKSFTISCAKFPITNNDVNIPIEIIINKNMDMIVFISFIIYIAIISHIFIYVKYYLVIIPIALPIIPETLAAPVFSAVFTRFLTLEMPVSIRLAKSFDCFVLY